ncbi:MAG: hypothetical protein QOJ65_1764 [Fimbriimonadaceae bacterium]|jgi:catechol 2,3-dioxygenase-like lactoylglutathione lyase family enzyme|nr:hypothetical protein [Fimbriimonadaceae bacterium]
MRFLSASKAALHPSFRAMEGVKLEGLTLHVANVDASVDFYKKIPGAELMMQFAGKFAMFKFGEGRLGLVQSDQPGFHVELGTEGNLDAMYEAVRTAGIEPAGPPTQRPWGRRDFHVHDPDGNLLEFE